MRFHGAAKSFGRKLDANSIMYVREFRQGNPQMRVRGDQHFERQSSRVCWESAQAARFETSSAWTARHPHPQEMDSLLTEQIVLILIVMRQKRISFSSKTHQHCGRDHCA